MGEVSILHAYTIDGVGNLVAKPVLGVDSGDGKTVKVSTDAAVTLSASEIEIRDNR